MRNRNLYSLTGGKENTGEIRDQWVGAIPGIVAVNEDPEYQDRVKAIIPMIDESRICDKWIRRLNGWVGPEGYGDHHPPALNSEIAIFGVQGEDHNLVYLPVYNEDFLVPEELRPQDVKGFKHDKDYKQLIGRDLETRVERDYEINVTGDLKIQAGSLQIDVDGAIEINAGGRIDLNAPGGVYANGVRIDI